MAGDGRPIPAQASVVTGEAIGFATGVIDSSGLPSKLEALLARTTGRPRQIPVRALLVALLVLALDGRAMHLKSAAKLLFCFPEEWRKELGLKGDANTR